MSQPTRRILVTSALPYANGPIHIGHLVEYIQTDIWVRFQKLRGHECHYVCADDAHGTPIMLRAEQDGVTPEQLIERVWREHRADFADFLIEFDNYYSTHSPENRHYAELIYRRLDKGGYISRRVITQAYDPEKQMFLPDRFIKGECPRCGAPDQYGDSCENCGATYSPTDLKNPRSVVSGATPILKESLHFFFKLADFEALLKDWIASGPIQPQMVNKLDEWFTAGLQEWDISRDAPYWGFEIPDAPGKYFYVWLDAPIGYMASFQNYCDRTGLNFDDFWSPESDAEVYHFIGKDIAYFHILFWPAELTGAGFRKPTAVHCHGFLTVDGQKMSKSRGTFIKARTYLNHLRPEYLRYYFASKLSDGIDDLDLQFRGLRAAGQQRPGRQAGQHRQPLRGFHHPPLRWPAWPTTSPNRRCTPNSSPPALPSPRLTKGGNSAGPCAKSWRWPTAPISTSTKRSPGRWPSSRALKPRSRRCAAWA